MLKIALSLCAATLLVIIAPTSRLAAREHPGPLAPEDWYWQPGEAQQHTVFWTAVLQDDTGFIIYVSLLRTNMGLGGGGNTGVAISVTAPDGTVTRLKRQYPATRFSEHYEPSDGTGEISIADEQKLTFGGDTHRLQATLDGLELDVTLTPWLPGYKFGDGRIEVDPEAGHFMKYFFLVPRADIKGTLSNGDERHELAGAGYLELMASNRAITLWARRVYVMNLFADDLTVHFMAGYPLASHAHLHDQLSYLVVSDRSGIRLASRSPQLTFRDRTEGPEGCRWPEVLRLRGGGGDVPAVEIRMETEAPHDAYIVLEQLGWSLRRLVGRIMGNPVFLRFQNRYELRLGVEGGQRAGTGRALHQVVCLR